MTVPGLSNGLPDINGNAVIAASALTVILVWVAGMFSIEVPPEVSSSFTTLIALGAGLVWGQGYRRDRRAGDKPGSVNQQGGRPIVLQAPAAEVKVTPHDPGK